MIPSNTQSIVVREAGGILTNPAPSDITPIVQTTTQSVSPLIWIALIVVAIIVVMRLK